MFLKVSEFAKRTNVTRSTVLSWVHKGIIKAEARRKGTRKVYMIDEKELEVLENIAKNYERDVFNPRRIRKQGKSEQEDSLQLD